MSVDKYILRLKGIVDSLNVAGQLITNEELIIYILEGLEVEYESIIFNLTS